VEVTLLSFSLSKTDYTSNKEYLSTIRSTDIRRYFILYLAAYLFVRYTNGLEPFPNLLPLKL